MLAAYDSLEAGGRAVTDIIAAGIVPAAIEMMDALSIEAAEAAVHCGYPDGAAAVLLVELDGPAAEVEAELATVRAICEAAGAREIRAADDPVQRAGIWAGRKSAFAAVGRLSPAYIVQDGVVPRTALGDVLARISALSAESGIRVANVFHAGDGNLHPLVLYNDACRARPKPPRRSPAPSSTPASSTAGRSPASTGWGWTNPAICRKCSPPPTWTRCSWSGAPSTRPRSAIRARCSRPRGCAERSLVTAAVPAPPRRRGWRFSNAIIPNGPGRLFPADARAGAPGAPGAPSNVPNARLGSLAAQRRIWDGGRGVVMTGDVVGKVLAAACGETREGAEADVVGGIVPAFVAAPGSTDEAAAVMRAAAEHELAVLARGAGSRLGWGVPPSRCDLLVDMSRMTSVVEHSAGDLVARMQAGARMGDVAAALGRDGQELALDVPDEATIGGVVASGLAGARRLRYGTPRDLLIGITIVRADGTVARSGGKVVKNVAGYDLGKLLAGSAGTLALITEATFRLHPLPAARVYVTAEYASARIACDAVAAAANSPLIASAVELSRPEPGGPIRLGVLLEGSAEGVAARAMPDGGSARPGRDVARRRRRGGAAATGVTSGGGTLIRVSCWVSALPTALDAVDAAARSTGLFPPISGSAGAGVLYLRIDARRGGGGGGRVRAGAAGGPGRRAGWGGCAGGAVGGAGGAGGVRRDGGDGSLAGPDAGGQGPVRPRGPDGTGPVPRRM